MLSRLRLATASAVLLMVVACQGPAVPPAEQYATISGTVVDASTNAPISGATVTINVVLSATTASNGTFAITNIPNGPLECIASATSYASNSSWCSAPLSPGQKMTVTIPLTHS